jgi:CubicO group peptidase (beta-lactamase class C family)
VKKILLLLASATLLGAQALPQASPAELGLSKERLDRIRPEIEKMITGNQLAGAIGLIARRGKIGYFETYGMADKENNKPIRPDSIFRIYSMTKAITGVSVMMLYEDGKFSLHDPISKYLPEFAKVQVVVDKTDPGNGRRTVYSIPPDRPITILDLLRHTSGLNYAGPKDEAGKFVYERLNISGAGRDGMPLADLTKRIAEAGLVHQPGSVWDYGLSIDVLGRLVEVTSGQPLDQFFSEHIFRPLKMVDTGFFVPEEKLTRLVALYAPKPDGTISRSTDAMQQDGYTKKPVQLMGGAGLASTAMDYARFVHMLLNGGELEGTRLLSPKTVDLMRSNALGDIPRVGGLPPAGYGFGLTFAVNLGPGHTGTAVSKGEYNWSGAAGTSFWIDPQEKMVGVFMMQTMGDGAKNGRFKQLAYQSIVEEEK